METGKLMLIFNSIAPEALAEDWDHSGIQLNVGKVISKILVSLEITGEVIDEAIENKAELIVTHHPLIFHELYKIDTNNFTGNLIIRLIQSNISVYSMHTSFDSVTDGNNDFLAKLLNLNDIRTLNSYKLDEIGRMGRIGSLAEPKSLTDMISDVKTALGIKSPIHYVGNPKTIIYKVALCTGSGASLIAYASEIGCDLLITGDVNYHEAQFAKGIGLSIIDAGHYHTEKIFIRNVANQLKNKLENKVEILESQVDQNPFLVI